MKTLTALLLCCLALVFSGCSLAGGGGCVHLPPKNVKAGAPIALNIEFSVFGKASGPLDKRYTRITCHYRDSAKTEFQTVAATVLSADEKTMTAVMVIPPATLAGATQIDYYFDFLFDGVYNRRDEAPLKIEQ